MATRAKLIPGNGQQHRQPEGAELLYAKTCVNVARPAGSLGTGRPAVGARADDAGTWTAVAAAWVLRPAASLAA